MHLDPSFSYATLNILVRYALSTMRNPRLKVFNNSALRGKEGDMFPVKMKALILPHDTPTYLVTPCGSLSAARTIEMPFVG